jgi:hypothetical protein
MLNLFVLAVGRIVINAASFQRRISVQGNGRIIPVTLRQSLILLSQNTINRGVKQGCKSQLDDLTCIISKYKAVFRVKYQPLATRHGELPGTRAAEDSIRRVVDSFRQAPPEPWFLVHERRL